MLIDSSTFERRHGRLVATLALTVVLTACSGMRHGPTLVSTPQGPTAADASRDPSDTEGRSVETITIEVGELEDISFSNNPSTGFNWMLAALPNGVYLVSVDDVPPTEPRPGAAGTRVFTIGGVRPGRGRLVFVLARPWELQEPIERVDYDVVVRRRHD